MADCCVIYCCKFGCLEFQLSEKNKKGIGYFDIKYYGKRYCGKLNNFFIEIINVSFKNGLVNLNFALPRC